MSTTNRKWADQLRVVGLRYPGAHIKSPWPGHEDLAVNDKTFAYLSMAGEPFSISCKLPKSQDVALALSCAVPTAYGLGRSGWVTATPGPKDDLPLSLFEAWIDESYRAQAPKKLVKELDLRSPTPAKNAPAQKALAKKAAKKAPAKKAPVRKTAAKKAPVRKTAAKKASKRG